MKTFPSASSRRNVQKLKFPFDESSASKLNKDIIIIVRLTSLWLCSIGKHFREVFLRAFFMALQESMLPFQHINSSVKSHAFGSPRRRKMQFPLTPTKAEREFSFGSRNTSSEENSVRNENFHTMMLSLRLSFDKFTSKTVRPHKLYETCVLRGNESMCSCWCN